ncbi:aryl-alcohol dehydrogenase-like predicted oxidoreductase [Jatrophihabitans sp. GAS493]|nr:aldo/keto reductase [Jatrophihabitans sp. GAS493]SOD73863.1 aryl-alcohol dehydrogenase-like predicted oxidoreductase [Jatrophihabitans sp. GAS493]
MERKVGQSGLSVSHLGLGTMTWGQETDADEAAAQLIAFRDAGGTLVDTAVSYGLGQAEQILGQLIADVVPREELVIATKAGIYRTETERRIDASRGELLRRLDQSLTQIGVDHVDLWYVHIADDTVGFEETLSALDYAVSSGKARYVGVSNYDGWHTARAATWQRAGVGRAPIIANQSRYSLLDRGLEREVLPACAAMGLGVLPYSPLGGGVLTGKYRTGIPADSRSARSGRNLPIVTDREIGIVEAVATAAQGLAASPIAVALAWVRDQPGITAPIIGARTLGQLVSALASETLALPPEIQQALDDVSRPYRAYPEDLS